MSDYFMPLLTTTDWNGEWKELQRRRRPPDDASYWDKRAATFRTKDAPSAYTDQFLAFAAVEPGATVLDMGCGNGALALPLASDNHEVIAADFSQGMLDDLASKAAARGVAERIRPLLLSWEDDWDAAGLGENCVDVAVASRSVATADLGAALRKLSRAARQRACATLTTGPSPHVNPSVVEALGLPVPKNYDYLYAYLVLTQMGYTPELRLIQSHRIRTYDNVEEATAAIASMIEKYVAPELARREETGVAPAPSTGAPHTLSCDQLVSQAFEQLPRWVEDNLVPNEHAGEDDGHGGIEKPLRLREPRPIQWAFLSWDTTRTPPIAW